MDTLIKRLDGVKHGDLIVCERRGVAFQRKMGRGRIAYDADYFQHYAQLEGTSVARALNAGRCELLARYVPRGARVLDVGIGSGTFIRAALAAGYVLRGFDICADAVGWLKAEQLYEEDPSTFDAVTFWDSLEHIEEPEHLLNKVRRGAIVVVAVPIMEDILNVRASKHYKPGEHLYYWTEEGFIWWMEQRGFRLLGRSAHEVAAGRKSIGAFAFVNDLPRYREHISAYAEIHSTRHYGDSATELHLATVADIVAAQKPRSILDYGCGRSDLVAHFWLDGARRIARYDPAIPVYRDMPEGDFDLVLCCDVLEHVPMAYVDKVLKQVLSKGALAFFTISLKLARARLPDGRNAHVTVLSREEWLRWLGDYFGTITAIPKGSPDELVVVAGKKAATISKRLVALKGLAA